MLRDLIAATEPEGGAASSALHGVKRPHDDEGADEPLAKRDRLGEELERMAASSTPTGSLSTTVPSTSIDTSPSPTLVDAPIDNHADQPAAAGTRDALPVRARRRRSPQPREGTEAPRHGPSGNLQ